MWVTPLFSHKVRNGQENLKREITCLKRLKHQNVIQLYDTIDDPSMDKVYLVFELANFLSLQDILDFAAKSRESGGAPPKVSFSRPVLFGMTCLPDVDFELYACNAVSLVAF